MKRPHSVLLAALILSPFAEAATEYHFDFGPPDSPVADGFVGIGAEARYSSEVGYGWSEGSPVDYAASKPPRMKTSWWHNDPHFWWDRMVDDFKRDCAEDSGPISFKVDLPRGRYHVIATLGNMNDPRYSVDVFANGQPVARRVDARMWLDRGRQFKTYGYYRRLRFNVDVGDDGLELSFKGDDAEHVRLLAIENAKGPEDRPKSRLKGTPLAIGGPTYDIGGPYSKVSLIGIEVYPEVEMPVQLEPETQSLSSKSKDRALLQAIAAFNAGETEKAEELFMTVRDPLSKGIGLLALAGHANYENEYENTIAAIDALKEGLTTPAASPNVKELLDSAEIFLNGMDLFKERSIPPHISPTWTWRALAELDQIQQGDLLYYKSRVLQGRYLIMLDAHQFCWASQEGKKRLALVEKKFPRNRYVRLFLHGDISEAKEWQTPDYMAKAKGAPEWAAGLYSCYNHLVDLSEWWALNKQQKDGSIGGGWGDDVELVGFFGFVGRVSEGASPTSLKLVRRLMNGLYEFSGEIDEVGGFYYNAGDAEHTAEYTGKTLPMVLFVDYGNPTWNERALQSAKLMKDLWWGVNERGHLHWRSNFLGASAIGEAATAYDSAINWRAARPAVGVLQLTNNPSIKKLALQYADSLYEDAMRTDKGKPKGIIPGDIHFETDEIGGHDVPTWYEPGPIPARANYGFTSHHGYRLIVFQTAYGLTGDKKYLEPIKAEKDYFQRYGGDANRKHYQMEPGSTEWIAKTLREAPKVWEMVQVQKARSAGEDVRSANTATIARETIPYLPRIRENWPYVTTEALATDRVGVPNATEYLTYLTGMTRINRGGHVTYRHVGRDFAAAVLGADPTSMTVIAYLFDFDGQKRGKLGLVPWQLELGARYKITWGPKADGDDEMDNQAGSFQFTLNERGQSIDVDMKKGTTYLIKIERIQASPFEPLLPDLAIGAEDIEYSPQWELLHVTVHNIGAASAGEYEVSVTENSGAIMTAVGNALDAPLDLTPKRMRFGFKWTPKKKSHSFSIEVKSRKNQPELTMLNNEVEATLEF
ncbi:hypothetical protein ACFL1X_00360 [Candidatus Hydrogenedentota bacterium]